MSWLSLSGINPTPSRTNVADRLYMGGNHHLSENTGPSKLVEMFAAMSSLKSADRCQSLQVITEAAASSLMAIDQTEQEILLDYVPTLGVVNSAVKKEDRPRSQRRIGRVENARS